MRQLNALLVTRLRLVPFEVVIPAAERDERVALDAYHVTGCRDWARIDVRIDSAGVPNIIEINPLPGILPNPEENSCLPKAARAAGYDSVWAAEAYGSWVEKHNYGKTYMGIVRSAFLIDEAGKLAQVWYKISPKDTPVKLLEALAS